MFCLLVCKQSQTLFLITESFKRHFMDAADKNGSFIYYSLLMFNASGSSLYSLGKGNLI